MGVFLYEILEHTFHFVKMEINQILNLLKRLTLEISRHRDAREALADGR
jgi:hypothetical protein